MALLGSAVPNPIAVCTVNRPDWLRAVVDEPGVLDVRVDQALVDSVRRRARKRGMLKEFRAFLLRGNVVDLAVAVVIGAAFKAIVDAFVAGIDHAVRSGMIFSHGLRGHDLHDQRQHVLLRHRDQRRRSPSSPSRR